MFELLILKVRIVMFNHVSRPLISTRFEKYVLQKIWLASLFPGSVYIFSWGGNELRPPLLDQFQQGAQALKKKIAYCPFK